MKRIIAFLSTILIITTMNAQSNTGTLKATLGGGCFWCLEAVFEQVKGVKSVVSGYAGGNTVNPTYEEVCSGHTGHAEVVQIEYDPILVSYEDLLNVFFAIHDPTTLNRQGADVGTQYRSIVFYHSPAQKATIEKVLADLKASKAFSAPIVTEVTAFDKFYVAEKYHQNYFAQHPNQPYCQIVISPKLEKFRKEFLK